MDDLASVPDRILQLYVEDLATHCQLAIEERATLLIHFKRRFANDFNMSDLHRSIRAYLSLAAGISKLLSGSTHAGRNPTQADKRALAIRIKRSQRLSEICQVDRTSVLHDRDVRNSIEHADERLDRIVANWSGRTVILQHMGIVQEGLFQSDFEIINLGVLEPKTMRFIWGDNSIALQDLHDEISRVRSACKKWLATNRSTPTFRDMKFYP